MRDVEVEVYLNRINDNAIVPGTVYSKQEIIEYMRKTGEKRYFQDAPDFYPYREEDIIQNEYCEEYCIVHDPEFDDFIGRWEF